MRVYEDAAAIKTGAYIDFTGYVLFCGTEAWVEHATFELIEAFDYDEMERMLVSGEQDSAVGPLTKGRISDGPYVDWKYGTWIDGVWKNGIWHYGTWRNGTWRNGVWMGGDWLDGTWENGLWYGGKLMGGKFIDGYDLSFDRQLVFRITENEQCKGGM